MVKSAVCSVAVNHFIHQIELRTLKAPSSQTQTPAWSNLGLQTRVKFSWMLYRKHSELPEPRLVFRLCPLDARENQIPTAARISSLGTFTFPGS